LKFIRDESRSLVNHSRVDVLVVRRETPAVRVADQVVVHTQVDRLSQILRADGDRRVVDRVHEAGRRFSEEGNRCDVVGHIGRHRCRHVQGGDAIGDSVRGHEAHDRRTLRESTEHHLGLGAVRRGGDHMCARIRDSIDGGGEVSGGGVVDRVNPDGLRADPSAQRVDERLSRGADTGCLGGAAGENHLGIRARRRLRGRNNCTLQTPSRHCRSADRDSDMGGPHGPMLTHPGANCAPISRPLLFDRVAVDIGIGALSFAPSLQHNSRSDDLRLRHPDLPTRNDVNYVARRPPILLAPERCKPGRSGSSVNSQKFANLSRNFLTACSSAAGEAVQDAVVHLDLSPH